MLATIFVFQLVGQNKLAYQKLAFQIAWKFLDSVFVWLRTYLVIGVSNSISLDKPPKLFLVCPQKSIDAFARADKYKQFIS